MRKIRNLFFILVSAFLLCGCRPGVSASCQAQISKAKAEITIEADRENALLRSMKITLAYSLEDAAALTGLKLPEDVAGAAALMREKLSRLSDVPVDEIRCEWTDSQIILSFTKKDIRGFLQTLGSYPSSTRFEDVRDSLMNAPGFVCE